MTAFHFDKEVTMSGDGKVAQGRCNPACTTIIKFMTDHELPPSAGAAAG